MVLVFAVCGWMLRLFCCRLLVVWVLVVGLVLFF